jgi:hypothetical protein
MTGYSRALVSFLTRPEIDALLFVVDRHSWIWRQDHAFLATALQDRDPLQSVHSVALTGNSEARQAIAALQKLSRECLIFSLTGFWTFQGFCQTPRTIVDPRKRLFGGKASFHPSHRLAKTNGLSFFIRRPIKHVNQDRRSCDGSFFQQNKIRS